jgi:hypothetical protein
MKFGFFSLRNFFIFSTYLVKQLEIKIGGRL